MVISFLLQVFSYPDLFGVLSIMGKTTVIYVFVVAGMRILGTRELGELATHDFVLIVVISNAVQNALVGGDDTLVGGLTSALTLLLLNRAFTWAIDRFPWLEHKMVGEPVVLVDSGHVIWEHMRREGVDRDELMAALREHGVADLEDVRLAILEVDGEVSVVPVEATVHRARRNFRGLRTT